MNLARALPVTDGERPAADCRRPCATTPWACRGYDDRIDAVVPLRVLPSSSVTVMIGLGDPVEAAEGSAHVLTVGPHDTAPEVTLAGTQRGLLLRCDPLVAYSTFGVPVHRLTHDALPLEALQQRLGDAADWGHRFAIVAEAMSTLLASGPRPDPEIVWAWRRLRATGGAIRVDELAAELGWSRRHLARRFREQVGTSPKTAARVLRFERFTALLADRTPSLAVLAATAGYADHAHLSRETRALTQWTPSELATRFEGLAA